MVAIMALRDEIYQQFGPLLLEAITDFLLDNVNTLRRNQGMPEISKDEYLALLNNHLSTLPKYDWMETEI